MLAQVAPNGQTIYESPIGNPAPSNEGLPAQRLLTEALGWLRYLALYGSLASLLLGALLFGIAQLGSSGSGKSLGKSLVIGGAIGALIAGLAPTIVNELFKAAQEQ